MSNLKHKGTVLDLAASPHKSVSLVRSTTKFAQ